MKIWVSTQPIPMEKMYCLKYGFDMYGNSKKEPRLIIHKAQYIRPTVVLVPKDAPCIKIFNTW
jgi:hypothetical protein